MKKEQPSVFFSRCTFLMVAMAGNLVSAEFLHEEQLVPGLVYSVSSPSSDSGSPCKVPRGLHHDSRFRKPLRRAFPVIITFLVAVWLMLQCHFVSLKQVGARAPVRRLAAGEEYEGEDDSLQRIAKACGVIFEEEISKEGEGAAPPAPPTEPPAGPSAGPSQAAPEPEEPRKKKRKSKWLETKEKEPPKKAQALRPLLPKEPSPTIPIGPSYAVLQAAPESEEPRKKKRKTKWLEKKQKEPSAEPLEKAQVLRPLLPKAPPPTIPMLVLQAPRLPPPAPGGGVQRRPETAGGHPPPEAEGAGPSQGVQLYGLAQQAGGTVEVPTTGQLPAGVSPLLAGPGDPGAPAGQPATTVFLGQAGTAPSMLVQRPVLLTPGTQLVFSAGKTRRKGGKAQVLAEGMVLLPATATAGRSTPPGPPDLQLHPFYRLPLGHSGGLMRIFNPTAALAAPVGGNLSPALKCVRARLLKDVLSHKDMEMLFLTAYSLVSYSSKWNPSDFEDLSPWHRLAPLAYRLLATDALWCICQTLGPSVMKTEEWWDRYMERVAAPASVMEQGKTISFPHVSGLLEMFMTALDMFKRRERPSAELLVEVKRRIFGRPSIHPKFKRRGWDVWRADDAGFK